MCPFEFAQLYSSLLAMFAVQIKIALAFVLRLGLLFPLIQIE